MNSRDPKHLEAFVHRTLRELPNRRAPAGLEARVLAAIAARNALPWWKKSFTHWPAPARLAFLGLSTAVVAAALVAATLWLPGVEATARQPLDNSLAWAAAIKSAFSTLGEIGSRWVSEVPALWLYAAAGAFVSLYATLFGVGAAAYRLLVQPR
jgi:hypothetical protein